MISVWLLFQALWQWVGENGLHYHSAAVCLRMKPGGDTQQTHQPYCFERFVDTLLLGRELFTPQKSLCGCVDVFRHC